VSSFDVRVSEHLLGQGIGHDLELVVMGIGFVAHDLQVFVGPSSRSTYSARASPLKDRTRGALRAALDSSYDTYPFSGSGARTA